MIKQKLVTQETCSHVGTLNSWNIISPQLLSINSRQFQLKFQRSPYSIEKSRREGCTQKVVQGSLGLQVQGFCLCGQLWPDHGGQCIHRHSSLSNRAACQERMLSILLLTKFQQGQQFKTKSWVDELVNPRLQHSRSRMAWVSLMGDF